MNSLSFYDVGAKHCFIGAPVTITSIWNSKGRLMPGLDYEGKSVKYRNEVELHYSTSNLTLEFSSFTYSPETDRAFLLLSGRGKQRMD